MKKRSQGRKKSLNWVRLYLEDFYAIIDRLKEYDDISIKADEWELENPEDIETVKDRTSVRDLHISCSSSYRQGLFFHLSRYGVHVSIPKDDPKSLGIFTAVVETVAASQSSFLKLTTNYFSFMLWIFGLNLIFNHFFLDRLEASGFSKLEAVLTIPILSTLTLVGPFFYLTFYRGALFFPQRKSEKPKFFIRNKDQIIVGVVYSLIVALIVSVFNLTGVVYWLQYLWQPEKKLMDTSGASSKEKPSLAVQLGEGKN